MVRLWARSVQLRTTITTSIALTIGSATLVGKLCSTKNEGSLAAALAALDSIP